MRGAVLEEVNGRVLKLPMRFLTTMLAAGIACAELLGQASPAQSSPTYKILRQDEDWSGLASEQNRQPDFFDRLKYVPLDESRSVWVSFGGQLRERVEGWDQFNFGAPAGAAHNGSFLLSRLFLHTDLHLGEHVRFFIQEKSAFSTHRDLLGGRRTQDADELDLQNAFLDLSLPVSDSGTFTFRAGRQEMLFGQQRFVGPSDWTNTRRTFNGFSGMLNVGRWNVTGFFTRPVTVLKYDFNHSDHNTEFYGVHSTGRVPASAVGIDLYWYALKHRQAVYLGTAGREIRHTLGASVYGAIAGSGLDYNFTASRQLGSVGTHNISAYMVIAQMGYRISRWRTVPRFRAGFDYASGGHSAGGDVGTFNLLFPSGHSTLGYMDIVGRQNVVDVNTGAQLKLAPKLSLELAGYKFWRAQANDAFYNKTGAVVFPGFAGSSRDLGAEANLVLRYELDRHTVLEAGYGHFFPGVFIQQSGPHQPPDFAYLSFQYTF